MGLVLTAALVTHPGNDLIFWASLIAIIPTILAASDHQRIAWAVVLVWTVIIMVACLVPLSWYFVLGGVIGLAWPASRRIRRFRSS